MARPQGCDGATGARWKKEVEQEMVPPEWENWEDTF